MTTAIYARVANNDEDSLNYQVEKLKHFLIENKDDVKVYADVTSGLTPLTERKECSTLLADIEKGEISSILITEISRISRNMSDFISFHKILDEKKIRLRILGV